MKICLVIGHKKSSPGACNESGLCEFKYNEHIVQRVAEKLASSKKIQVKIVYRKSYAKKNQCTEAGLDYQLSL